jgi:hypothetical protein
MDYRIKESNRRIPGGALPGDCNLTFDDPLFDFGDGQSTAEIHELSFVRTLGLPAGENAEDGIDLAGTHLLGFLAKPGIKSALPVMDGLFQKGRRHAARIGIEVTIPTPTLHDGSGANTLRLDTKKGTRILVPANTSLIGVPAEPSEGTDHYKCYQVKTVASGPFGTLQDAAGRELRGLQVQVEDQFGDGQGHPVYGDARRFDLRNVTELCNPVAVSNVDTVEEDGGGRSRTTSCMVTPTSISHPNTSLLCWRTRVAVADIQQPWDGMSPATLIAPRQEKHEKRALATDNPVYLGHELAAPDRVDTVKEMQICFPVLVTDRGSIKP